MCFSADIDGAGGATTTSLASDAVTELADETILTSKFYTPGGVGGEEVDMGEVEVECEQGGVSDVDRWGSKREDLRQLQVGWALEGEVQ